MVFILSSCASYSSMNEKEWLRDQVNTNEFSKESISKHKAIFSGSTKNEYSNIPENVVNDITLDFLNMLQTKYSKNNIIYNPDGLEKQSVALYNISYEILNNTVNLKNHQSARTECYMSSRSVSVRLDVENIESKTLVWSGIIDKELESSNCSDSSELESETLGGAVIEAFVASIAEGIVDSATGTYKEPPSVFKVASKAILGFYRTMP